MYLNDHIAVAVEALAKPLLNETELFIAAVRTHADGVTGRIKVLRLPKEYDYSQFRRTMRQLEKRHILAVDSEFRSGIWQNLSVAPAATAEDAFCIVDPFAHISFLSAMQRHGLTDRSPSDLQITTLPDALWRQKQLAAFARDLPEDMIDKQLPRPHRIGIRRTLRGRMINLHRSKAPRDIIAIRGSYARITSIGSTFVDMLTEPEKCGGIRHVIECFEKNFTDHADEIIESITKFGSSIAKVRAGYIIDEWLGVRSALVDEWVVYAQRGGSRLLDPKKPYGAKWSEKWMMAINA
jgi:predicted transcriptional regulator of viral defense system